MNDLINYLTGHYKRFGTLPSIADVAKKINRSEEIAVQLLEKLKKQGVLGFHEGKYYLKKIDSQPLIETPNSNNSTLKKNIIARIFSAINNFLFNETLTEKISENIIKVVMLAVAVCCMIVSCKNTHEYFLNYLVEPYCSLASMSIVIFGVFAFQVSLMLSKKGNKFVASLFFIAGVIALCICMVSTIHTQYKNNKIVEVSNNQTKVNENIKLLKSEQEKLNTNITNTNKQIESNQKRIDFLADKKDLSKDDKKEYNTLIQNNIGLRNRLDEYDKKLTPINDQLQKLYNDDKTVISKSTTGDNVDDQNDFYSSLSKNLFIGMDAQRIAMLLYTFFAVFMDIMAPLGVAVFLGHFNKGKVKKDNLLIQAFKKIFNIKKSISESNPEPPAQ